MRAIWKGAVSFGLVNVPVRVYAATGEKGISFHQVHESDGGRIRYKRVCSVDGEEVGYGEIAKGYETDDGQLVLLTDDDLAELPLSTSREIDVLEFVPSAQVDPILFAKAYYLEPDKTAAKPYSLLRQALQTTDRVAVVKVALRQRETLAVLRVRDNVILLQTMLWPDEVREPDFEILDADVEVRPQELTMASSLVESLASDFDPDQFEDGYAAALRDLIEAKVSSGETRRPPAPAEPEGGGEVVDLLTALQRSVEKARGRRGEGGAGGGEAAGAAEGTASAEADTGEGAQRKGAPAAAPPRKRAAPASSRAKKATAEPDGEEAGDEGAAPKAGTAKAGTARSGTAQNGTAKTGAAKAGAAKAGAAKAKGAAKTGTTGAARKGAAAAAEEDGGGAAPKRAAAGRGRRSA
jgi:DNA end-binding protein Ku